MNSKIFHLFRNPHHLWRWMIVCATVLLALLSIRLSLAAQWEQGFNFGSGAAVQLVDPGGLNRMPVWPGQGDTTVTYSLYPLTASDFVKRFAHYDPYSHGAIDTAGLTVSTTWQQSYTTNDWYAPQYATFPANVASGIYVIQGDGGSTGKDAEYVVVGHNALMLKRGAGGQVIAWASNLQGQSASAELTVSLYDQQGSVLATAQTDASGVAHFTLNSGEPFMAVAQGKGETTIAGFDWQWASDGFYWWWDSSLANGSDNTLYLYTDRPIYRPNQTIYYQAFLRQRNLDGYGQLAASTPISLTLRDARSNVVATQSATLDEFGALHGEFTIGDAPPLGWWNLELAVNGQTKTQRLRVEEYRKPEYQVTVTSDKDPVIAGDSVQITVAADYYFGQPVANAKMKLTISRYLLPRYGWYWWYDSAASPYQTVELENLVGKTDANGKWSTSYTPDASDQYDSVYTFHAEVTDDRELPIAAEKQLRVHWNSFAMTVRPVRWGFKTSEAVPVNITTRNHDGSAATGKNITVRIIRDYWDQTPESDAVPPQSGTSDSQGNLRITLNNVPQGWYRVEATATDDHSRTVLAVNYLWVYDPHGHDWYYFNSNQLSILADKESYAPGDTAELLIQSKVNGLALLTLERDGIYREQLVKIEGPVTSVQVPIDAQLAPNVVARIHIFQPSSGDGGEWETRREGRMLMAKTELVVPATDKALDVKISTNAAKYKPGDTATLALEIYDDNGNPVRARVGLALVDEAIYALQSDLSADLFDTFWGRRSSSLPTYDSLQRQPWGYNSPVPDQAATPTPDGTPVNTIPREEYTVPTQVRRQFEDTAYWNATITTDADGKATIQIKLPDNLTTWRIIAKAISADALVGVAQSSLLVTQEIIARPALPRFGVVGDRFQAGIVTQNFSGGATSGTASVKADGLVLFESGAKNVNLANGGSSAVNWTAVAAQSGTKLVTATLQTGAGGDIVELPFPVKPFAVPDRWLASGQANPSVTETFNLPLNAVTEQTTLQVRLSPSLALGVLDGLDELIDYPYGCVEQTMSRLLPSAVASKAYADLGIPNPKAEELPKIVEKGLQKIYGFQHGDGSWGWFYDDTGGAFLTSYVLFGLISVEDAGFTVDTTVVENGFAYLDKVLLSTEDAGVRAFAQYVKALAGRGDAAATQALLNQINGMDASQIASLALALHLNGNDHAANSVLDALLALASETTTTAYWQLPGDYWNARYWQSMASDEKNTALAVRALATLRPTDPKLSKAVRWLLEHRKGAGWGNTQATSFAVLGLVDVIKATGELQPNYDYTIKLNGQPIASGNVTPQTASQVIAPITLMGAQLTTGDNLLQIERSTGTGSLYYTARLDQQLYYDGFTPVSSLDHGLAMARSYTLKEGMPRNDGAYNVGDLVEVTLNVRSNQQLWYVLISDPIPAGFEVVQERMNLSSWGNYYDYFYWREWGYNQKDARDDRVEFFVTQLWQGDHTYTYLMRAIAAGDFSVLPGTASPMYKDEVWGRSASQRVLVAPEKLAALPTLLGDFDRSCQITSFDAQLTASAFGTANTRHDLNGDGIVDLRDVAAVGSWLGATCGTQRSVPGAGNGSANFSIATDDADLWVGDEVRVTVSLSSLGAASADASALGGFDLKLNVDPSRLSIQRLEVNPALGKVIPLGPQTQGNLLSVGLYGLPANLPANTPLATLVLRGSGVGSTTISVASSEAVDDAGRVINANATGSGSVTVDGKQVWLPLVAR